MEILYKKVLDDLLINQDKHIKTEQVKVFVNLLMVSFPEQNLQETNLPREN
jgi:hypothetical protein